MFVKNAVLYIEKESVYGTDPTPTAADAIEAWDIEINPNRIIKDRNQGSGVMGSKASFISSNYSSIKFKTWFAGNGTLAEATQPIVGKLFDACGFLGVFTSLWTHTWSSTAQSSATAWFYLDGIKHVVNGMRGVLNFPGKAGEPAFIEWSMIGKYAAETAVAMLTPTNWQSNPLVFQSADFELGTEMNIGGIENLTIKQNGLNFFPDINNVSGFGKSYVSDLDIDMTIDPEATVALKAAWETAIGASTIYASHVVHGAGTGEKFTFILPAVQIMEKKDGNRNNILTTELTLKARNAVAGSSDAMSITIE